MIESLVETAVKERKERRDKGVVQVTERDNLAIKWIAEQTAIRFDQLQRLLYQLSDKQERAAQSGAVSYHRAKFIVDRWLKSGWVGYKNPFKGQPGFVWVTHNGMRDFELEYRGTEPELVTLRHCFYVNEVRFWSAAQQSYEWLPEREMKRRWELLHYPDAEMEPIGLKTPQERANARIAVEVERTRKKASEIAEILDLLEGKSVQKLEKGAIVSKELERSYGQVWYFVVDDTQETVLRAMKGRDPKFYRVFQLDGFQEVKLFGKS